MTLNVATPEVFYWILLSLHGSCCLLFTFALASWTKLISYYYTLGSLYSNNKTLNVHKNDRENGFKSKARGFLPQS
jgi:hypothetical protein